MLHYMEDKEDLVTGVRLRNKDLEEASEAANALAFYADEYAELRGLVKDYRDLYKRTNVRTAVPARDQLPEVSGATTLTRYDPALDVVTRGSPPTGTSVSVKMILCPESGGWVMWEEADIIRDERDRLAKALAFMLERDPDWTLDRITKHVERREAP